MLQVEQRIPLSTLSEGTCLGHVARDYPKRASTWPLPMEDLLQHLDVHRHTIGQAMCIVCPDTAPFVMEMIQLHLDSEDSIKDASLRKTCFQCLAHLNKRHGSIPASIHLSDVVREGSHPLTSGGYADIWKGRLADKEAVCLKVLRVYTGSFDEGKLRRQLGDEVLIWRQLRHPNIHRFLGVTDELFQPSYCIVSPWMTNGDVMHYTRERKVSFEEKLKMMQEISEAIQYLHEHHPPIIHSDIKGINILVSNDGHCLLNDFGLATIECDLSDGHIDPAVIRGSVPWLAPELMSPDPVDVPNQTTRDIYALGCTIFELLTGTAPFSEKKREPQIIVAVLHGFRPERPQATMCPDWLWKVIEGCWGEDARKRLRASEVVLRLREMLRPEEEEELKIPVSSNILRRQAQIGKLSRMLSALRTEADSDSIRSAQVSFGSTPPRPSDATREGDREQVQEIQCRVMPPLVREKSSRASSFTNADFSPMQGPPPKPPPRPKAKLSLNIPPARPKSPVDVPIRHDTEVCLTVVPRKHSGARSPNSSLAEALDWFFDEEDLSRVWDAWFLRNAWERYQDRVGT